jgi:putative addiction module killer protein
VRYFVQQTQVFLDWRDGLRDAKAKAVIARRIERASMGLLGDTKSVGGGVSELRIDYGPGYRLYFAIRRREVVILLAGGDKSTQRADIKMAQRLVREV